MGILDNQEIEIPCSKCGNKTKKTIGWIKANQEFICVCGTIISLNTDQFRTEIAKVDAAFARLQDTINKFKK